MEKCVQDEGDPERDEAVVKIVHGEFSGKLGRLLQFRGGRISDAEGKEYKVGEDLTMHYTLYSLHHTLYKVEVEDSKGKHERLIEGSRLVQTCKRAGMFTEVWEAWLRSVQCYDFESSHAVDKVLRIGGAINVNTLCVLA
jgi:hypothetical protein